MSTEAPPVYTGEERRKLDPNGKMLLMAQAGAALNRRGEDGTPEFADLNPETRRDAVERAKLRDKGAFAGQADPLRGAMLNALACLDSRLTPEQMAKSSNGLIRLKPVLKATLKTFLLREASM